MAEDALTTVGIGRHGAARLPSVDVDRFNIELKNDEGLLGERAQRLPGFEVDLVPIRFDPDEAGLIGRVHLAPSWIFEAHDGILVAGDEDRRKLSQHLAKMNLARRPSRSLSRSRPPSRSYRLRIKSCTTALATLIGSTRRKTPTTMAR